MKTGREMFHFPRE